MDASVSELLELELIDDLAAEFERCHRCRRTLLVGEQVHVYDAERTVCDLCRSLEREPPATVRPVHGPAFGNTIRIIDQRSAV
jgi:hypothetical protein